LLHSLIRAIEGISEDEGVQLLHAVPMAKSLKRMSDKACRTIYHTYHTALLDDIPLEFSKPSKEKKKKRTADSGGGGLSQEEEEEDEDHLVDASQATVEEEDGEDEE